jgi:hypothetical protein
MNENKTPITLRVNGVYKSRNGYIYGPMRDNTSDSYYAFTDRHHTWRKDGGYHVSGMQSPLDLISEITPAPHRSSLIYGQSMVGAVPVPVPVASQEMVDAACISLCGSSCASVVSYADIETRRRVKDMLEAALANQSKDKS